MLIDARNNLMDMYLLQSLNNEVSFDLAFLKYPATSINSYFYKMTLRVTDKQKLMTRFKLG